MTEHHVALPLRRGLGPAAAIVLAVTLAACATTSVSPSFTPIPPGDGAPPTAPATVPGPPSAPPTAPTTPMPSASPAATAAPPAATASPESATPAATQRPATTHPAIPASMPATTPRPTPRPTPRVTASALGTITGHVTAGPTCPVARFPPDPRCADKPVAGAEIVVTDAAGREVARVRTDSDGAFAVSVPPGTYTVTPQPVQGIMRTGGPQTVSVTAGQTVAIDLAFDTGIR
jgi:hypothetical protein